ncbi:MAG: glycosyltransferase family 4 protein [Planctomycetota bacterium]|jgi:glycosyltransferase involved in cell wall biosynthesis
MKILCYRNVRVPDTTANSLYTVRSCAFLSHEVPVCLIAAKGRSPHAFQDLYGIDPDEFRQLEIRTPSVRHKGLSGIWRRMLARRWLKASRNDSPVAYVSQSKPASFLRRLKCRNGFNFHLVVECHDFEWGDELQAADGIIYTSESLKAAIIERHPDLQGKPSRVWHHKLESVPDEPPASAVDPSDPSRFLLCYAGSILPWKDLDTVVEAMALLADGFHLRIIGGSQDNGYRDQLIEKSRRLGLESRIEFTTFVPMDRLRELVQESDATILSLARSERLRIPYKILEYLSWARPVIAADVDCLREVVRHGENGLLFEPESPCSLAEQIRRLADASAEERREMVIQGIETLKPFSARTWSQAFVAWLHDLMGPKRCR